MTTTEITIDWSQELTKKQIIERLFNNGHITFNEMWTLLGPPEVKYIPFPQGPVQQQFITPYQPFNPGPFWTEPDHSINCNDNNSKGLYFSSGGEGHNESY